jgi:coatomer subunit beta'
VSEDSFYILKYDRDAYTAKLEEGVEITDEGVEEAFDVVTEISDRFSPFSKYFVPN